MADDNPIRLDEYCKRLGVSFFDVTLPCLFCKFTLTVQDLASFYSKDLCLVWRGKNCFACCTPCLKLCAKYEQENYSRCIVSGYCIEGLLNISLCNLLVRCLYCFKKLDYAEKIDCCVGDLPFCLIRHHWRNCCRLCKRTI